MNIQNSDLFLSPSSKSEFQYLLQLVQEGIDQCKSKDFFLLENGANERCLCHRLAKYMEDLLQTDYSGYVVDTEYNRGRSSINSASKMLGNNHIVLDIAAHIREPNEYGEYKNLIAIEMKKKNRPEQSKNQDRERLKRLVDNSSGFGFTAGFFIVINNSNMWIENAYSHYYEGLEVCLSEP